MAKRSSKEKEYADNHFKPFEAKNQKQKEYFSALDNFTIVLGHGCAGTGKTALAVSYAAEQLYYGNVNKIIITRPAIEAAGEHLGFIPGEIFNKFAPYLAPVKIILEEVLGKSKTEMLIKNQQIEAIPLAYCRGHTFNDAIIIGDEFQNTTPEQTKMLLTRMGHNCKSFINGDTSQTDIRGMNGLQDAILRLSWIPYVKIVNFKSEDIVRSGIISDIISAYQK